MWLKLAACLLVVLCNYIGLASAKRLGGMGPFFLVLQPNKQVYGVGSNDQGQLAMGSRSSASTYFPVAMLNVRRASDVCGGEVHSCVVDDGVAKCAGSTANLLLGLDNFTTTDGYVAQQTPVPLPHNASAVFCGQRTTCAITTGAGAAYCWGDDSKNQMGTDFALFGDIFLPPTLLSVSGVVTQIGIGAGNAICALNAAGQVWCAGDNRYGELGIGNVRFPGAGFHRIASTNGKVYVGLATGSHHSCARDANGNMDCWGYNADGVVGVGLVWGDNAVINPTPVWTFQPRVAFVSAGIKSTFAILTNGSMIAFGLNAHGAHSTGNEDAQWTPTKYHLPAAGLLVSPIEVRGGLGASCVLDGSNSNVWCVGSNAQGQLGIGKQVSKTYSMVQMKYLPGVKEAEKTLAPTSNAPTMAPSRKPTPAPTLRPTKTPTSVPTAPTARHTLAPTAMPSSSPTASPTAPTKRPTAFPTRWPTTGKPTKRPTAVPTRWPTTVRPTKWPTTARPTKRPTTRKPTKTPTSKPTTCYPTRYPTKATEA